MDTAISANIDSVASSHQMDWKNKLQNDMWTHFSTESGDFAYATRCDIVTTEKETAPSLTLQRSFTDEVYSYDRQSSKDENFHSTQFDSDANYSIGDGKGSYGKICETDDITNDASTVAIPDLELCHPPSVKYQIIDDNRRKNVEEQTCSMKRDQSSCNNFQRTNVINNRSYPQHFPSSPQFYQQPPPMVFHPVMPPVPYYGYPVPYMYAVPWYPPMFNQPFIFPP